MYLFFASPVICLSGAVLAPGAKGFAYCDLG